MQHMGPLTTTVLQRSWPGAPRALELDTADKVLLAICKEHTSAAAAIILRGTTPTPFVYF